MPVSLEHLQVVRNVQNLYHMGKSIFWKKGEPLHELMALLPVHWCYSCRLKSPCTVQENNASIRFNIFGKKVKTFHTL